MAPRTFTLDRQGILRRTAFNSAVAACAAPLLAYLADFSDPIALLAMALAATALTWALFLLRQLLGGTSALTLDENGITFTVRGKPLAFAWQAVGLASFQSINDTPWLVVTPQTGKRRMLCLESFDPESVQAIMDTLHNRLADRFEIQETWILANRSSVTVCKQPSNGV